MVIDSFHKTELRKLLSIEARSRVENVERTLRKKFSMFPVELLPVYNCDLRSDAFMLMLRKLPSIELQSQFYSILVASRNCYFYAYKS